MPGHMALLIRCELLIRALYLCIDIRLFLYIDIRLFLYIDIRLFLYIDTRLLLTELTYL